MALLSLLLAKGDPPNLCVIVAVSEEACQCHVYITGASLTQKLPAVCNRAF